MSTYKRGKDGKFAGSIGNGKSALPTVNTTPRTPPPPATGGGATPASVSDSYAAYVELTGTTGHVIEMNFRNSLGQHVAAVTCPVAHGTVMVSTDERGMGTCTCGQRL